MEPTAPTKYVFNSTLSLISIGDAMEYAQLFDYCTTASYNAHFELIFYLYSFRFVQFATLCCDLLPCTLSQCYLHTVCVSTANGETIAWNLSDVDNYTYNSGPVHNKIPIAHFSRGGGRSEKKQYLGYVSIPNNKLFRGMCTVKTV